MSAKKPVEPSPESVARAERQRLAQEEGVRAMADVERRAAAVRQNMQRLRALREAKEAEKQADEDTVQAPKVAKKKRSRSVAK